MTAPSSGNGPSSKLTPLQRVVAASAAVAALGVTAALIYQKVEQRPAAVWYCRSSPGSTRDSILVSSTDTVLATRLGSPSAKADTPTVALAVGQSVQLHLEPLAQDSAPAIYAPCASLKALP